MGALRRSCSGEAVMGFQPPDDSLNLRRPLAFFRLCRLPQQFDQQPSPEPEVASRDGEQRHTRGSNTPKPLVSIASSPEARSKTQTLPTGPLSCSIISDVSMRTKRSPQDKTMTAEVKKRQWRRPKSRRCDASMTGNRCDYGDACDGLK